MFVKSMVQLTIIVFKNAFSTKPQIRNIKVMQMLRSSIPGVIIIKKPVKFGLFRITLRYVSCLQFLIADTEGLNHVQHGLKIIAAILKRPNLFIGPHKYTNLTFIEFLLTVIHNPRF